MTVAAARPTVLVSTPTTRLDFAACVLPVAQHRPFQALFGYEGQLAAMAAGLAATGVDCALLPAPEIFGHPAALAAIRARLGADHPLVHLRFGATGAARLLKGATNLFVAGDDAALPPIDLGWHPFAGGDRLPPLMAGVLSYGPQHRPLSDLAGTLLPTTTLPAAACCADLDLAAQPGRTALAGLQVQSLAEFARSAWSRAGARSSPPSHDQAERDGAPEPLRSADLQAALAGAAPRRLIALPWNLAHPGGIVADLAVKLARRRDPAAGLMLLPFNLDGDAMDAVPRLAGHVRAATDAPEAALRAIFVGRLRTPRSARALRGIASTAWVDGSDPEAGWTLRRLERLGIAGILIAGGLQPPQPPPGARAAFHADAWMQTELHTPFGRQLQRAATVSARRLGALLGIGLELGAALPPAATPTALGKAMRPLARQLLPDLVA